MSTSRPHTGGMAASEGAEGERGKLAGARRGGREERRSREGGHAKIEGDSIDDK